MSLTTLGLTPSSLSLLFSFPQMAHPSPRDEGEGKRFGELKEEKGEEGGSAQEDRGEVIEMA